MILIINEILKVVKIFPSPFKDVFTIEGPIENSQITISDLTGKVIYSEQSKDSYKQISIENLAGGIYYLRIESENSEVIRKIIKL